MIKFFRTIRKSFLLEGKTKGYIVYAIGEIVLVVIGILIALSINNWNASSQSNHAKVVVLSKIEDEIKNNKKEISNANPINQNILKAYNEYSKLFNKTSAEVIASSQEFRRLQNKYPGFFRVKDSSRLDAQKLLYEGGTTIGLDIPDLTSIAWETTRTIGVANEFDYDCLYELENTYNLQARVKREIDKASDVLLKGDSDALFRILRVLNQLELQLLDSYDEMLTKMVDCK